MLSNAHNPRYFDVALQHKVCHVPRETIEHVALFHVKQLTMLHRTICFVASHNVAVQYVAVQHAIAAQHRIVVQCSYRSAALLRRSTRGGEGPAREP
jgi:hypothetical protein